jgi:hypothetical protein
MSNIFSEILSDSIRLNNSMTDKKNHKKFVSTFLSQNGGSFSKKSVNTDDEVNQLISMLTSDSEDKNSFSANSTQTEALENKLRNMTQNGGAAPDSVKVKEACDLLKNSGYTFSVKGQDCNQYIMSNTSNNFMDQISSIFTSKSGHVNEPPTTTSSEVRSLFLPIGSTGNSEIKTKEGSPTSSARVPQESNLSTTSIKSNTPTLEIPKRRNTPLPIKSVKGPSSLLDVATGFASGVVKQITNTIGLTQESGVSSSLESSSSNASKLLSNPSITSSSDIRSSKVETSFSPATVEQQLKGGGKKNKKSKKISKKNGSRKNRK